MKTTEKLIETYTKLIDLEDEICLRLTIKITLSEGEGNYQLTELLREDLQVIENRKKSHVEFLKYLKVKQPK